jgi:hypothetical protein
VDGVNDPPHLEYPARRTLALRAERTMCGPSTSGGRFVFWEAGGAVGMSGTSGSFRGPSRLVDRVRKWNCGSRCRMLATMRSLD